MDNCQREEPEIRNNNYNYYYNVKHTSVYCTSISHAGIRVSTSTHADIKSTAVPIISANTPFWHKWHQLKHWYTAFGMWGHTVTQGGEVKGKLANGVGSQYSHATPPNVVYPALLKLMRTTRLPAVDWTDAPTDLNGLVRFGGRRNLVSARVPSHSALAIIHKSAVCLCRGQYWKAGRFVQSGGMCLGSIRSVIPSFARVEVQMSRPSTHSIILCWIESCSQYREQELVSVRRIWSPDRPARRQSLYRLRYPAHCHNVKGTTSLYRLSENLRCIAEDELDSNRKQTRNSSPWTINIP